MTLASILSSPAFWGLLGAFGFAGPRWAPCAYISKGAAPRCTIDLIVSLMIGAIFGAAATAPAMAWLHLTGDYLFGTAAFIGLLANPVGPAITKVGPKIVASMLSEKLLSILKGPGNEP